MAPIIYYLQRAIER